MGKRAASMQSAKKSLLLSLNIGEISYKFEADMFDLDSRSIPNLSDQISKIPSYVAYVIEAHGQAEKELAKKSTSFDVWLAKEFIKLSAGSDKKIAETAKRNLVAGNKGTSKKYEEKLDEITELKKLVSVLNAYRKGMDAKLQLAQTLSANMREERESYRRDYDKENKKTRKKLGS